MKTLIYTITRANSKHRARLLHNTLSQGRERAKADADWVVFTNGAPLAEDICSAAKEVDLIQDYFPNPINVGQHLPTNTAIDMAIKDYDYLVRVDDDTEFETFGWLTKLITASQLLEDKFVLSPTVKGLSNPLPSDQVSEPCKHNGVEFRIINGPIGGICRLMPVSALRANPYISDVRAPMGLGDASGVARWAIRNHLALAYLKNVKVKHAKTTEGQYAADPEYRTNHTIFQSIPYIPVIS